MSWDILFQDLPADAKSVADIPEDFKPGHLGRRVDVIAAIRDVAPDVNFSDPSWGHLTTSDFDIEFNVGGDEEVVKSMMLHVRGGDSAVDVIAALCDRLGSRAIDLGVGEFFTSEAARESFTNWRDYRRRVVWPQQ